MSSTEPADQSTDVAINRKVTATFDRDMDAATLTSTTFTVTDAGGAAVAGVVTYDPVDRTATFAPGTMLAAGTRFTATLATGVADLAGEHLAAPWVWTFLTGATADLSPPGVLATLPADGAIGSATNDIVVVTFDEPVDATSVTAATFTLAAPGPVPVVGAVATIGARITFRPDTGLAPGVVYTATVGAGVTDLAGNALGNDHVFTFTTGASPDAAPPVVLSTIPADGAGAVALDGRMSVTFDEPIDPASLTPATFTLRGPVGEIVVGTLSIGASNEQFSFTPGHDLVADTAYTAFVTTTVEDLAGNALAATREFTFTTRETRDDTTPWVAMRTPDAGAVNVAVNQSIVVAFSEAVDPTTIDATTFMVTTTTTNVAGTLAVDGANVVFTPGADLPSLTAVTVTLTTGIADLAGNALPATLVWSFTTSASSDSTPPTVASTTPADTAAAVAIDTSINATFDEAIDPATLDASSFTVAAPGPVAVAGTVTLDPTGTIATFAPSADLAANTTFTATISTAVHDLAGNALATDFVWTFTTDAHSGIADVDLASAATFGVMATDSTVETGTCTVNGDVAVNPGTGQGFVPGDVNGTIHVADEVAAHAESDLSLAYADAAGRSTGAVPLANDLANLTLTPGLYKNIADVTISTGSVTLDAQGDPTAVFLLQIEASFTTGAGAQVVLANGASASHVFWQVAGSVTLGAGTTFAGSALAAGSIAAGAGCTIDGRLLSGALGSAASVALDTSVVTVPTD